MDLKQYIHDIPDFPKPGILFRDISPLLQDVEARNYLLEQYDSILEDLQPTMLCGLDARGFIIASLLAEKYSLPLVMIRKPGKLPGKVIQESYELEYGSNALEIQSEALGADDRVLILDDLLATGGTMKAGINLVRNLGAEVVGTSCIIELTQLGGAGRLGDVYFQSLIKY